MEEIKVESLKPCRIFFLFYLPDNLWRCFLLELLQSVGLRVDFGKSERLEKNCEERDIVLAIFDNGEILECSSIVGYSWSSLSRISKIDGKLRSFFSMIEILNLGLEACLRLSNPPITLMVFAIFNKREIL